MRAKVRRRLTSCVPPAPPVRLGPCCRPVAAPSTARARAWSHRLLADRTRRPRPATRTHLASGLQRPTAGASPRLRSRRRPATRPACRQTLTDPGQTTEPGRMRAAHGRFRKAPASRRRIRSVLSTDAATSPAARSRRSSAPSTIRVLRSNRRPRSTRRDVSGRCAQSCRQTVIEDVRAGHAGLHQVSAANLLQRFRR